MKEQEENAGFKRLVEHDPVEAARLCQAAIKGDDESFQEQRRRRMAWGSLIAERLKGDHEGWRRFVAQPFFDQYRLIRKKDKNYYEFVVMRAVMLFLFEVSSTNKSKRNRVWRYARAMEAYADAGVPNDELVARIKTDGGIEKACREACKEHSREREEDDWEKQMRARPEPKPGEADPSEQDDEDEIDDTYEDEELDDEDYEELSRAVVPDEKVDHGPLLERGPDPSGGETVELEMPPKMKAWLRERKDGERLVLRVECEGTDEGEEGDDRLRLRAIHAFQWPSARF